MPARRKRATKTALCYFVDEKYQISPRLKLLPRCNNRLALKASLNFICMFRLRHRLHVTFITECRRTCSLDHLMDNEAV